MTGATNGIGLEIARGLLARGADLILPCRNAEKGGRVRDELQRNAGGSGRIDLVSMAACTADYPWSGPLGGLLAYCRSKLAYGLMRLHAGDPALDATSATALWDVCEGLTDSPR